MFREAKLRKKLKKNDEYYQSRLKQARAEGNEDDIRYLEHNHFETRIWIEEEWRDHSEFKLIRKARRLLIPIPSKIDEPDAWQERSPVTDIQFLTPIARKKLWDAIREEHNARRDMIVGWITPLTGIIGALTGLVAVIGSMW